MRKGTKKIQELFMNRIPGKVANSVVTIDTDGTAVMLLHGSKIAKLDAADKLYVTLAGYNTPTTRDRLNSLPGLSVHTAKGTAYLNGVAWDGSWILVN